MTTNRLDFFRQQIAAFEPSSDPQKAIEKGYYIEQPRNSLANMIANKIALRPSSRHLLIGGIGSGKTTQLLMTCDKLNEIEDISTHYVDVSLYTDISKIKQGSLLAITGLVLSQLRNDWEEIGLKDAIHYIHDYAYGYRKVTYESSPVPLPSPSPWQNMNKKTITENRYIGKLTADSKLTKQYRQIYEPVKDMKEILFKKISNLVVVFDGLDRFNDNSYMLRIIDSDIELISQLGIGIILVGSISLNYSGSNYFNLEKMWLNNLLSLMTITEPTCLSLLYPCLPSHALEGNHRLNDHLHNT